MPLWKTLQRVWLQHRRVLTALGALALAAAATIIILTPAPTSLVTRTSTYLRELPSTLPSLLPRAPLRVEEFCGAPADQPDKQCSGPTHGTCMMYRCFCRDGWSGPLCQYRCADKQCVYGRMEVTQEEWRQTQDMQVKQAMQDNEDTQIKKAEEHVVGFGWHSTLPLALGDVLEIGGGAVPQVHFILTQQWRTVDSVTMVDAAIQNVRERHWSPVHYGTLKDAQGSEHRVEMVHADWESTDYTKQFDTIICVDMLSSAKNAYTFLEKVYAALRPGGVLVFYDTFSTVSAGSAPSTRVQATRPLVEHFLTFFHRLYANDPAVRKRFELTRDPPADGVYFIGVKRSPEETFERDHSVIPSPVSPHTFIDHFHLIWTTAALQPWRLHVLDSVFANHPKATVHIYGNQLTPAVFKPFYDKQLKVILHAWNDTAFFYDTPLAAWSRRNFDHYNYRVHVSDAFRLAVVWKYGGVYMDFDLFILNPLYGLRNMIAREAYRGMVNGALLIADPHHPFVNMAMVKFHTVHNITIWHSSGPLLQSKMVHMYQTLHPGLVRQKDIPEPADATTGEDLHAIMNVYSPTKFYPHPWQDARNKKFWDWKQLRELELRDTLDNTYMFHVWTAMIGSLLNGEKNYLHPHSFMGRLIMSNCVALCDSFMEANKDLLAASVEEEAQWEEQKRNMLDTIRATTL